MGTLLNRRRYMGGSALPYDAEVEYLAATGTQYIDTGFYPRTTLTDITVENKFNKSVLSGDNCVLGARTGTTGTQGMKLPNFYNATLEYQAIAKAGSLTGSFAINTDYTFLADIKQGTQDYYIDGTLNKSTTGTGSCDTGGNLFLFAINQSGAKWFFKGKIYYCKIWQDDILERDFIPVRVGQVGYMYDRVSRELFGNAGSGTFILGPDKT